MLQCVAMGCNGLQRVAVWCSVMQCDAGAGKGLQCDALRCSVLLQCFAVYFVYGVATVSRIDKIIGLFCKRAL